MISPGTEGSPFRIARDVDAEAIARVHDRSIRAAYRKIIPVTVLDTIRLSHLADRMAANLSHGQKQWLEIGMLIAQDPKILLVDEPAAGMTDAETAETAQLLRRIAANHTVIVVEHDMDFIRDLDVKVTVLHEGSVLAEGTLDHVSADPKVVEVYLGRS